MTDPNPLLKWARSGKPKNRKRKKQPWWHYRGRPVIVQILLNFNRTLNRRGKVAFGVATVILALALAALFNWWG